MTRSELTFAEATAAVLDGYEALARAVEAKSQERAALEDSLRTALRLTRETLAAEPTRLPEMSDRAIDACFELQVIDLLSADEAEQLTLFASLEDELRAVLQSDTMKSRRAGSKLVGCLLLALDELPLISDRVLALLGSLTGRREGLKATSTSSPGIHLSSQAVLDLSKLLEFALFGEVFTFLAGLGPLQEASNFPGLSDFPASIVSIASRKGGVGKSTLALAVSLTTLRRTRSARVCILDLDITGPIWQYLLCPNGRTATGFPLPYLNRLIDIDQPDGAFNFGTPLPEAVWSCVAEARLPEVAQPIGLLTFADLPRTNRYIVQAIANNRASFTEFIVCVLRALSQRFDLIVIDNTPGFDPHALITLVIAGAVPHGLPLILSTEHAPDLRGTFLELSDLRLLRFRKPPLWIVNKASEEADRFFSEERTLIDIADMTRGYAEIMPDAPVLKRLLRPRVPARMVRPLPFDDDLARPNNVDFAGPLTTEAIRKFVSSHLFRRFEREVGAALSHGRLEEGSAQ